MFLNWRKTFICKIKDLTQAGLMNENIVVENKTIDSKF